MSHTPTHDLRVGIDLGGTKIAGAVPGGPVWAEGLAADVTPGALVDLPVEPGAELWFAVKAAEVAIHPAGRRT